MTRSDSMRQFVRFSTVGLSGFAVDFGVYNLLTRGFSLYYLSANIVSFSLAVVNNFIWHKRWTFRDVRERAEAVLGGAGGTAAVEGCKATPSTERLQQLGGQFSTFVLVSVIGLTLNTLILATVSRQAPVQALFGKNADLFAKVVATGIVWFWNFGANKLWTFRKG